MKKALAFLLAVSMILLVICFAGCGEEPPKPQGTTTSGNTPVETTASASNPTETTGTPTQTDATTADTKPVETTAETIPPRIDESSHVADPLREKLPGFEDVDFRGKTFVFALEDESSGDGWNTFREVYPDASMTDAISIASRERTALVEKLYNCKIELYPCPTPQEVVAADITSQKYTIDFYSREYSTPNLWTSGDNYNLLDYIDATNPWWDQNFVSAYTAATSDGTKVLCSILGDFSIGAVQATHALLYNKELYENAGITEDIYALVRTGKWTVDRFVEMVKAAKNDASGDQLYKYDDGDTLGWARTGHATHGLHVASGLSIIDNQNGIFSFAPSQSAAEWVSAINTAIELWNLEGTETLGYTYVRQGMEEGKILFASEVLGLAETMRDANISVGIVPYPKFSETQENYAHYVDNHVAAYSMPVSVTDPELCGKFFEVFTYHSKYIVREAVINTYSYTYCSDADSYEMLKLVLASHTFDPGYLWWSTYEGLLSSMISSGTNNVQGFTGRYGNNFASENSTFVKALSEKFSK